MIIYLTGTSSCGKSSILNLFPDNFLRVGFDEYRNKLGLSVLENKYYTNRLLERNLCTQREMAKDAMSVDNAIIDNFNSYMLSYLPDDTFKVIMYANLNKITSNVISRKKDNPRDRQPFEQLSKKYTVTDNYNESIDTIDSDSFIKELKRVKWLFESEEALILFVKKQLELLGILDTGKYYIKPKEIFDYILMADDKTSEELRDELLMEAVKFNNQNKL